MSSMGTKTLKIRNDAFLKGALSAYMNVFIILVDLLTSLSSSLPSFCGTRHEARC